MSALPRFFCPCPLAAGSRVALPENAARHAVKARRLKTGDALTLFNGQGGEYAGKIVCIESARITVDVEEKRDTERESPLAITLIQALQSGEKMDMTIQKAVELGVSRIVPVASRRSVQRLDGDRARRRLEHWRGVALSACEQCGRNRLPEIETPRDMIGCLQALSPNIETGVRWMLHPDGNALSLAGRPTGDIKLLIGAEGGFDPEEIRLAHSKSFVPIRLGPRILRTETAGMAAVAAIQLLWGDF